MCEPQSKKKYLVRNSPSFPANKCCGMVKMGNDGVEYISRRTSAGICRWMPTSWNTSDKVVQKQHKVEPIIRDSPSVKARDFPGLMKKGGDGKMYVSTLGALGRYRWVRKVAKK
jgi:hypothetical protein